MNCPIHGIHLLWEGTQTKYQYTTFKNKNPELNSGIDIRNKKEYKLEI
jgi:hypothetical protein